MTASTGSPTTMSSYDMVDGGSIPEMLSDGANSYVYGPEVMGEVTPVEQISSSGATSFCFSAPSGVQAVVAQGTSSTPAALSELAAYSITGIQTLSALGITTTSAATPFGFQGAYQDATGLDYLYNRVYDPRSAQMLSVDPKLLTTEDPYGLDGGDSLNMSDPLGLRGWYCMQGTTHYYAGDRYGVTGPGGCNFGQFGQYCAMEDVACYESAFFGDEAQAVAFDELMVELASIRSEPSSPEPQVSGPTSAAASGGSQSSGGSWPREPVASIGQAFEKSESVAGCIDGVRDFWTSDAGIKLLSGELLLAAITAPIPGGDALDAIQTGVVIAGGSTYGCVEGIIGQ